MKKRIFTFGLALTLVLAVLLTGCGTQAAPESKTTPAKQTQDSTKASGDSAQKAPVDSEPVTITYGLWDANQATGFEKMIEEFAEANPNIKIEIQLNGWADYWTALDAAASSGTLPDTFWMHSNNIYRYTSNEMLMDLTKKIAESSLVKMENFPSGLVSIYNFNGKQYCVPKDYDTIGLWYSKTMFDEAGVKYPDATWTWNDLYDAAKKLTKPDKSQYGFLAAMHNQEGFYNFIYQNGGSVITQDKKSGYDDPKTIEAMEFYVKMVKMVCRRRYSLMPNVQR